MCFVYLHPSNPFPPLFLVIYCKRLGLLRLGVSIIIIIIIIIIFQEIRGQRGRFGIFQEIRRQRGRFGIFQEIRGQRGRIGIFQEIRGTAREILGQRGRSRDRAGDPWIE